MRIAVRARTTTPARPRGPLGSSMYPTCRWQGSLMTCASHFYRRSQLLRDCTLLMHSIHRQVTQALTHTARTVHGRTQQLDSRPRQRRGGLSRTTGQGWAGQGLAGQGTIRTSRAEQGRGWQDRAQSGKAGQGMTEQDRAEIEESRAG